VETLRAAFTDGWGLQTGFADELQSEAAELLCSQTSSERVRFTTSGTLATLYAIMLARSFTGRPLVLKAGGGWHGGQPWGLKGIEYHEGYGRVESDGIPAALTEEVFVTAFNDPDKLEDDFRKIGNRLSCLILEPVMGAGGLLPASRAYLHAAQSLCQKYGALLILDEVITGFRYHAGSAAQLYGVDPDLSTFGKIIGGGMPVAAVAGKADIMALAAKGGPVKFSGGTYAGHPACMLAAKTMMQFLSDNESLVYPKIRVNSQLLREKVKAAFATEGFNARFTGDRNGALEANSLHMLVFPFDPETELERPEQIWDPSNCDIMLSEVVLRLALLLENVHTLHGIGSVSFAHEAEDLDFLAKACQRAARRIGRYAR
jgi:glutamate-1-semialdehyde 2,1-aminomutase